MTYRVELSPAAQRDIRKIRSRALQRDLVEAIAALGDDPRPAGSVKLRGIRDLYRIRVRYYRVIYAVSDKVMYVLALRAGDRRDVYDHLDSLEQYLREVRSLLDLPPEA